MRFSVSVHPVVLNVDRLAPLFARAREIFDLPEPPPGDRDATTAPGSIPSFTGSADDGSSPGRYCGASGIGLAFQH